MNSVTNTDSPSAHPASTFRRAGTYYWDAFIIYTLWSLAKLALPSAVTEIKGLFLPVLILSLVTLRLAKRSIGKWLLSIHVNQDTVDPGVARRESIITVVIAFLLLNSGIDLIADSIRSFTPEPLFGWQVPPFFYLAYSLLLGLAGVIAAIGLYKTKNWSTGLLLLVLMLGLISDLLNWQFQKESVLTFLQAQEKGRIDQLLTTYYPLAVTAESSLLATGLVLTYRRWRDEGPQSHALNS